MHHKIEPLHCTACLHTVLSDARLIVVHLVVLKVRQSGRRAEDTLSQSGILTTGTAEGAEIGVGLAKERGWRVVFDDATGVENGDAVKVDDDVARSEPAYTMG